MKAIWPLILLTLFLFSVIYCLLNSRQRQWANDYFIPIAFFLIIAGRTIWHGIGLFGRKSVKRLFLVLLSINNILILTFMTITIVSYIIRTKPQKSAVGIKERGVPLFAVFFHLIGSYFIANHTTFHFHIVLYISGLIISILGIILDCIAIWQLKRFFSIMVEVRELVCTGIYARIRHPLYAGELIHFFGIALLFNNIAGYTMFVCLIFMQSYRAILEERKLSANLPEYSAYKKRTGFFLPRFRSEQVSDDLLPPGKKA